MAFDEEIAARIRSLLLPDLLTAEDDLRRWIVVGLDTVRGLR
ncbi:MAG: hypothetical protein JWR42_1524 [Marmoricola sp.]|nr:hypothetical protein [Marmoricola sp.]